VAKDDMTKFTNREKRKATDLEQALKKEGVPPREAEQQAWKQVGENPDGKRKNAHTYTGRAKTKSSSTPKSRKTRTSGK
jgi:hypothetical protein